MKKIYKTSRGTPIDIDALRIRFENEIAVGNMRVNAKGDTIGKKGQVIEPVKNKAIASHQTQKAIKQTSLKSVTPQQIQKDIAQSTVDALTSGGTKKTISAPVQKNKKQVKLPNGDIVLVDEDQDPNEQLD